MTLQLLHSEFPHIWGKFDFLFYRCRGIPIAPMLETLLLDEDSLLLTWSISTVLQIFNAVLFNFLGCFSSDCFFSFAFDYFHSFFSNLMNCWTFFASLVSLDSLLHGSATLTLKRFLLTSVLAYLWTRFSGSCLLALFLLPGFWQFPVTRSRFQHCCCTGSILEPEPEP